MTRVIAAVVLIISLSLAASAAPHSDLPPLPSLAPKCEMFVELISVHEDGLFVRCKGVTFRVYHPTNLFGHVAISNADAAVLFVRFFTSRRTFYLLGLHGDVEIRAKGDAVSADAYSATKIVPDGFPVTVTQWTDSIEGRVFRIQRYVVSLDQRIYRITERVTERGSYHLSERLPLGLDASKIGIVHIGRH